MSKADNSKIDQLLSRNVEEVIEKDHLTAALASGKKLRVKLGIDPTSPDLHLGHAVILRKLREFQSLGNTLVLIIGDFTARIGDPSGRTEARKPLTEKEIEANLKDYLKQAGKIIDIKKAEIVYNSSWFEKKGIEEFVKLASAGTLEQVLRRADFKKRIDEGKGITFLELLYPLFQGYDSVMVKADVEVGGTDQTFNLLTGRRVQHHFGMAEQDMMTFPLLVGLDGVKKMSKSLGNYIALNDAPEDMFGKTMSVPDALVESYFLLCTDLSEKEIKKLKTELGPKDLKVRLGFEIVKIYHGEKEAKRAQENFDKVFSKKEIPTDLSALKLKSKTATPLDIVMASGLTKSKGEARRLIEQGGFDIKEKNTRNPQEVLNIRVGDTVRIGKRHYFKLST